MSIKVVESCRPTTIWSTDTLFVILIALLAFAITYCKHILVSAHQIIYCKDFTLQIPSYFLILLIIRHILNIFQIQ